MKTRIISVIALLLCALTLLSGCTHRYKRLSFTTCECEDVSYLYEDAEVVDCMSERFAPETLPVYEISTDPFTDPEIQKLKDIFHPHDTYIFDENHILLIISRNSPDDKEFVLSDGELEEKAWEYFNMIPEMDAKDFGLSLDGGYSAVSRQDEHYITERTVKFYRVIDGFRVSGSETYSMTFNADGELKDLSMHRYSYKRTNKTIALIPEAEAFSRIKNPDLFEFRGRNCLDSGKSVNDHNHAQKLEVDDFEIKYVNAFYDKGCTILQPVYVYTGRALGNEEESEANTDFVSQVIAISEKCTYTPISLKEIFGISSD